MQVDAMTAQTQWDQKRVKDEVAVSLLKKSMDIQKELMQKMLEQVQQIQQNAQKTPPANPDGNLSLYA